MSQPLLSFPASQRLRSKRRIDELFEQREGGAAFPLRYLFLEAKDSVSEVALLVSVPKRLHKRAHTRNLLKRRIREAFRLHKEPLRQRCHEQGVVLSLGFLYTSPEVLEYRIIERSVKKILEALTHHN